LSPPVAVMSLLSPVVANCRCMSLSVALVSVMSPVVAKRLRCRTSLLQSKQYKQPSAMLYTSIDQEEALFGPSGSNFHVSRLALPMSTVADWTSSADSANLHASSRRIVAPAKTEQRKGVVLMLHGWAQNALVMRNKTQAMAKYVYV